MNDFYAQLEHQLVEASRRRAQRPRRRTALAGRGRPLLAVATVLLAVAAAVVLVPVLRTGSTAEPGGGAAPPAPPAATPTPLDAPPSPDSGRRGSQALRGIRVAVLNGTTTAGAARAVGELLERHGATIGAIGNGPDQLRAKSAVDYRPGRQVDALRVGHLLGVTDIRAWTGTDVAFAQDADIVVQVGNDRRGR